MGASIAGLLMARVLADTLQVRPQSPAQRSRGLRMSTVGSVAGKVSG
jgi:hypothetical protein